MYFGYAQYKLPLEDCNLIDYKQKGFAPVLILVGIAVSVIIATGVYLKLANSDFENCKKMSGSRISLSDPPICQTPDGKSFIEKDWRTLLLLMKRSESISQTPQTTSIPSVLPSPAPTGAGETANWKTFTYNNYMFEYPSGWDVRSFGNINDMNGVDITRVDKVIAITITNKQYPYGFEGPDIKFEKKTLNVEINGKVYKVNEVVVNGRSAFVDFSTDLPNKVFIKFGTGYPAAEDKKASLSEYNDSKEIILKILSTFKFTN